MNSLEYLMAIENSSIDIAKKTKFEECYGIKLSDSLAKIVTFANDSIFIAEERRVLSFDEIININKDCDNVFISKRIIPVIDCYDNEFIVFAADDSIWAKFSLSDNAMYKKRENLSELI